MGETVIQVEVAYAKPDSQFLKEVEVRQGASVKDAINASGVLDSYPEIDLDTQSVGIFGRVCDLDRLLDAGDRVEIYRPLMIDPKDARRERVKKK